MQSMPDEPERRSRLKSTGDRDAVRHGKSLVRELEGLCAAVYALQIDLTPPKAIKAVDPAPAQPPTIEVCLTKCRFTVSISIHTYTRVTHG